MIRRHWAESQAADFRRQLMLPEQKQLFDYWLSLGDGEDWPRREAVSPTDIRKLVSNLLLLKMRPLPEGVQVRLAGSETWDIYGGELTGATLTDDRWGKHADYWRQVYATLQDAPQPMHGHLPRFNGREHMALFWLRLPLRDANGDTWLLGLDMLAVLTNDAADTGDEDFPESSERKAVPVAIPPRMLAPHDSTETPRPNVVLRRRAVKTDGHVVIN